MGPKFFIAETVQRECQHVRDRLLGQSFDHYEGGRYRVTDVVVDKRTGELRIDYMNMKDKFRWSRTQADFTGLVEVDGRLIPRFKLVTKP